MTPEATFVELVETSSASLFRTAFMLTGDEHRAQDLLQDTFARLYAKRSRLPDLPAATAYARRSLINNFISQSRRRSAVSLSLRDLPDVAIDDNISHRTAERLDIMRLLSLLTARQRAVVVARYLLDMPDDEIARWVGCRQATVRSLASRALTTLRANIAIPIEEDTR